ncbi:MAG: hypothetical protein HN392_03495 [Anaerolineae bacterium]|nr:hypothetical protein [Anaerolineae bacterium]
MDILNKRIQRVVESVLDNEALTSGLDETAAEVLQGWGIKNATSIAGKVKTLDDEHAEREMYPHLKASRRLIRAIRIWLEHEKKSTLEEKEKLWAKVEKRAQGLYGDALSLPSPNQFSGNTPAEFIENLRNWLEGSKD